MGGVSSTALPTEPPAIAPGDEEDLISALPDHWRGVWAHMPELVLGPAPPPAAATTASVLLDSIDAALNSYAAPTLRSLDFDLLGFVQYDVPASANRVSPWLRFASQRLAGKLRVRLLLNRHNMEELVLDGVGELGADGQVFSAGQSALQAVNRGIDDSTRSGEGAESMLPGDANLSVDQSALQADNRGIGDATRSGEGAEFMLPGDRLKLNRRNRGKHGPEGRIAPMLESAMARAIRTAPSRAGEPVFLPAVGMEFNSAKEAKEFYNLYSWEIGFGIRTGRAKVNGNNYTTRQDFVCSCEGVCPSSVAATVRTGCKAMIRLHRTSDHGWLISSFKNEHNHRCSASYGQNKQWPSHSDIDPMTKEAIRKLRENNIPIGRVCSIVGANGSQPGVSIRKEVVRSLCARIAQENIKDDIGKTTSLLEEMKRNDVGMEVRFKLDADRKIVSMLWCTGKNRADYAKFGDVVTFDTTYRTNLYNLPFGIFVGVNNHFQSIVFGGVLVTTEKTEDFEWAFSNFAEIMGGNAPQTILTDQCKAMAAAIKSVFPKAIHRWCRWHVLRKTKQKVGPVYSKKSKFKKEFNKLVTEETVRSRFERRWRQLMRKYNLEKNVFMERIFKFRAKWARPYFMEVFCAGMTSTQRSESANHMLKQFIQRSAPMHMFVRKFNEFPADRNEQEEKEVHVTKQMRRKHRVGVPIERHAELIYTRRIYEKFYNELYYSGVYSIKSRAPDGTFEVVNSLYDGKDDQIIYKVHYDFVDKVSCQCGLFEHLGLLCRHSLKVLVHCDVKEIPKGNMMARWMKDACGNPDGNNASSGFNIVPGTADVMKRRAIVNSVLEFAYGSVPISEELYAQFMGVMDRAWLGTSVNLEPGQEQNVLCRASGAGTSTWTNSEMPLRCPDRPTKKGRPSNTSIESWKEEQKRKNRDSTDEENARGGKMRLLADVLAG